MPIYEYVCQQCDEPIEKLQKLSDGPLIDCPACGEPALKRKISAVGFRLSGGGWYETDFKSDGKRNLAGSQENADKKSSDGDASTPSKSSESAPSSSEGAKTSSNESGAGKSEAKKSGTNKSTGAKSGAESKSSSSGASKPSND